MVENDCIKLIRFVGTVLERIQKVQNLLFFGIFSVLPASFLKSQSYHFNVIAHKGPPHCVQRL